MKSKYISFVTLLAAVAVMEAQPADAQPSTPGYSPDGVELFKNVVEGSAPNTYTINLEAFVTGESITTEVATSAPCDYVLVLDNSSSMTWDLSGNNSKPRRIDLLKEAANNFIDLVKADAENSNTEHRISIVSFGAPKFLSDKSADQNYNDPSNSNFLKEYTPASDEKLKYTYVLKSFTDVNETNYASLKGVINRLDAEGQNTASHYGMQLAYLLVHHQSRTTDSKGKPVQKIIIFLTDGEPTINGNASWADKTESQSVIPGNYKIADMTIDYALDAKKDGASIWGLSIIKNINTNNQIYMECVSSNYPNATKFGSATYSSNTKWKNHTAPYDRGEGDFFYDVSKDKDALKNAFAKIAEETVTGGAEYKLEKTTTTVIDVVSPAFKLPDGADGSKITLRVAKCKGVQSTETDGSYVFTFYDPLTKEDTKALFPDIEAKVGVLEKTKVGDKTVVNFVEKEGGKAVSITGFGFSDNWVGPRTEGGVTSYAGYKLIISFPIEIDPSNPGGATESTNTEDSGIYTKENPDAPWEQIGGFEIPKVKIPNIIVIKNGLKKGDSAIFNVYKVEKDGTKSQFPIQLVATCKEDGKPAIAKTKIQKTGRYLVEETTWSWAYGISECQAEYPGYEDSSSITDKQWHEKGFGKEGETGYPATIPFKFGTDVTANSITRNVNDFTEQEEKGVYKGTLFIFSNEAKTGTPAHAEANVNNVFYECN